MPLITADALVYGDGHGFWRGRGAGQIASRKHLFDGGNDTCKQAGSAAGPRRPQSEKRAGRYTALFGSGLRLGHMRLAPRRVPYD